MNFSSESCSEHSGESDNEESDESEIEDPAGLVVELQSCVASRQQQAADAVYVLTCGSQSGIDALIAAGAVPVLVA